MRLPRRVVSALGVALLCSYGGLYYTLGTLAARIAGTFSVSDAVIYGWFSGGLLLAGLLAPGVGSLITRYGASRLIVLGAFLSSAALMAMAFAPNLLSFGVALIVSQLAGLFVFYDAAFAAMAEAEGEEARSSITELTLIAGFASTLYWPLTVYLADAGGWRMAYGVFAGVQLLLVVPLELYVATRLRQHDDGMRGARAITPADAGPSSAPQRAEAHPALFAVLATIIALHGLVIATIHAHLIPVLTGLGGGAGLVFISSMIGPSQVVARFGERSFQSRLTPVFLTLLSSALLAVGLVFMAFANLLESGITVMAIAFALTFGAGQGLSYIVRGVVPLVLFGREGYALRLGRLMRINLVVSALTPFFSALVLERLGQPMMFVSLAGIGLVMVVFAFIMRQLAAIGCRA